MKKDEEIELSKKIPQVSESIFFNLWTSKLDTQPTALIFSSDSQILFLGTSKGCIYAFDLYSSKLLRQTIESNGSILALYLQNSTLYSFSDQGLLIEWGVPDMKKLKESRITKAEHEIFSHALFKPNDLSLVFVRSEKGLYMDNSQLYQVDLKSLIEKNLQLPYAEADNQIDHLAFSKDGRQLAVTSCTSASTTDGDFASFCPEYISVFGDHFFEYQYNEGYSPFQHEKNVAVFSPDGKQIVVSSSLDNFFYFLNCPKDASLYPYDIGYSFEPLKPPIPSGPIQIDEKFSTKPLIRSLDWAAAADLFAAGGSNGVIIFWTGFLQNQLFSKKIFDTSIEHLMFSPDGNRCALLSADKEIVIMGKSK